MTDISPRRRRAGRWALGLGAALALPLTATVVYAGQDAPEPLALPPSAVAAPEAPTPPEIGKVEKRIIVMEHRDHADAKDKHDKDAKFERKIEKDGKTIVIRSDQPIEEADLAKLEKLDKLRVELPRRLELLDAKAGKAMRRFVVRDVDGKGPHGHAMAFAVARCEDGEAIADADASHESGDSSAKRIERTRIVMCSRPGNGPAEALAQVRSARDRIADNDKMSAEVRDDILRQLDETIAKLERESK